MYKLDMDERHEYYNKNISNGRYPISLKLANYLYKLCWQIQPEIILDHGTGFSSFVFRKYALMSWRDVKIYSVDTKQTWLDKSKGFVRQCGLTPSYFYLWPEFISAGLKNLKFDLILEDSDFTTRIKNLPGILDMLDKNGHLIVDDANLDRCHSGLVKLWKRKGNIIVKHLKVTGDSMNRHAALVKYKR